MLAALWIGVETSSANAFMLSTASLSALGYENSLEQPVIRLWNETHHLRTSDDRQTDANRMSSTGVIQ
jgi:probable phosphoglycerate mutase